MNGKRTQILVVDDTAISLAAIERTLKEWYEIITVNSGTRALRYLQKERPDLILLDIRMANKDGIETLREMREMPNGKDIPVIMLTSTQDSRSVIETSKLGIYDYVLKPYNQADLIKRVRAALEKAKEEAEEADESSKVGIEEIDIFGSDSLFN